MGYLPGGVTLDQLAEIAKQETGGKVTVLRDLDPAAFRDQLRLANDTSRRYVVNFTRGPLFGLGGGHHSPIAGYLIDEDLILAKRDAVERASVRSPNRLSSATTRRSASSSEADAQQQRRNTASPHLPGRVNP